MVTTLDAGDIMLIASGRVYDAWDTVLNDSRPIFSDACREAREATQQLAEIAADRATEVAENDVNMAPASHNLNHIISKIEAQDDCLPGKTVDLVDRLEVLQDSLFDGGSQLRAAANDIIDILEKQPAMGRVHCYTVPQKKSLIEADVEAGDDMIADLRETTDELQKRLEMDIAATDADPIDIAMTNLRACVLYGDNS